MSHRQDLSLLQSKLKRKKKTNNDLSDFTSTICCVMFVKVKDWLNSGSRCWYRVSVSNCCICWRGGNYEGELTLYMHTSLGSGIKLRTA